MNYRSALGVSFVRSGALCSLLFAAACGGPITGGDASTDTTLRMDVRTDTVSPPDARRDVANTPDASDPCAAFAGCEACAAEPACGFCRGTGRCQSGGAAGSDDGMCRGTDWSFVASECSMPDAGPDAGPEAAVADAGDSAVVPDATPVDDVVLVDGMVPCAPGLMTCGPAGMTSCADLQSDPANCGACGTACAAGELCQMGVCRSPCMPGETRCSGTCVDTASSMSNCGACGTACGVGQSCRGGMCIAACGAGEIQCGMRCVNPQSDAANCGACGNTCAVGQSCVAGACVLPCAAPRTLCGSGAMMACVDVQTDAANCGMCGTACAAGQSCRGGACTTPCPAGQVTCGGSCVNTQTDNANCGMCGTACASGQTCTAGTCRCPAGQTLCGTGATAVCRSLQTDNANCGACARVCAAGQNCLAGACANMPPANDTRAGATMLDLTQPSFTVMADTTNATNNTMGACGCTSGRDVFFRFTLTQEEIVYADNFGTTYDASLFLQDAAGVNLTTANIPGGSICNDDSCGVLQSQLYARLAPGTYFLVTSGCSQGPTSIRFQHLPVGNGALAQITPTGSSTVTGTTSGVGRINSGVCSGGPENTYFFATCPSFAATAFQASTCGTTTTYDASLEQRSAGRAPVSIANDDSCGLQPSIAGTIPAGAGLHTINMDSCSAAGGAYQLRLLFGACTVPTTACNAACVNTATSSTNCGACNNTCQDGATCAASACVCPAGGTYCSSRCVNTVTDNNNCGRCGTVCGAGTTCQASLCRPANNDRVNATALTLTAAELTVTGTNANATADVIGCTFATNNNVWYRFTLAQQELVYVDTAGSAFDTTLFLTNSTGVVNTATCNDDASCAAGGGFTAGTQSRFAAVLAAGTYYVSVGGFGTSVGNFTLHLQHIPTNAASFFYAPAIAGTATTATTTLVSTSRHTPTCTAAMSGEDARWFMSCGIAMPSLFSLCQSDGATFTRRIGTNNYDPAMSVIAGTTGASVACNDDGPGTSNCRGTGIGADTNNYGSRISVNTPRGINMVIVDERTQANGMQYTLRHQIR